MQCVRCGYCCKNMMVVIVDDSNLGIVEGNVIGHIGNGTPCKHLQGDKPGSYSCVVHNESWYPDTPCARHRQFELADSPCRMGTYILEQRRKQERQDEDESVS